jgi:acyl carrier protein
MSDDISQRVLKVIATSKRIPLETVTIDAPFEQLNIDSMDAVEILFALENEFDISIPDDDVRTVRSVRQMCEGVEKLVAAKAAKDAGAPPPAGSVPEASQSGESGQ